jgi:hypothetical protein
LAAAAPGSPPLPPAAPPNRSSPPALHAGKTVLAPGPPFRPDAESRLVGSERRQQGRPQLLDAGSVDATVGPGSCPAAVLFELAPGAAGLVCGVDRAGSVPRHLLPLQSGEPGRSHLCPRLLLRLHYQPESRPGHRQFVGVRLGRRRDCKGAATGRLQQAAAGRSASPPKTGQFKRDGLQELLAPRRLRLGPADPAGRSLRPSPPFTPPPAPGPRHGPPGWHPDHLRRRRRSPDRPSPGHPAPRALGPCPAGSGLPPRTSTEPGPISISVHDRTALATRVQPPLVVARGPTGAAGNPGYAVAGSPVIRAWAAASRAPGTLNGEQDT